MSAASLSEQQLRAMVEERWRIDEKAPAVGLHVANGLTFPAAIEVDGKQAQVVRAESVFQVREVLLEAEQRQERVILLTPLHETELGLDVVARLARTRLFPVDQWASLCSLFKAKELEQSIGNTDLAQALLEAAPADGYPPVSAGVLDSGTVWRAVCRHVLDMGEREPDLVTLLLWATDRSKSARYALASEGLREALRERLVANLGDAAAAIFRFVDANAGSEALALAVVCQVVFGDGDDPVLEAAAARIEQFHDNQPIPRHVGVTLGRIAAEAVADLDRSGDPKAAQQHLQRADELVKQFRCDDHTYRSRLTRMGFEQRLAQLGEQIATCLASGATPAECERRRQAVLEHRLAKLARRGGQVARTEMALRLLRWLATPVATPTSFSEMVEDYRRELAFVDWARESVCRGDEIPILNDAYRALDHAVAVRREQFNRAFGHQLVNWTSTGSTSDTLLGVEYVLAAVAAKICEAGNAVLLVVLDGMSWAVCHELLEDLRADHWFDATLDESSNPPPPVIATLPSVTGFSRASLLSGTITKGDATVERRNFEAHASLLRVCEKRFPPQLYHKREATEAARGVVGEELTRAILEPRAKVVAVVINAIDDRLSTAQQVRDHWTLDRISLFGAILKLARDTGRVVVLASDHGHVWHPADAQTAVSDGGSRWRGSDGPVSEGEVRMTGSRVRDGADKNSIIVPWSESLHYGRPQNGYHGGATPQEMVCPLVILKNDASTYGDLSPCDYPKPDWWFDKPAPAAPQLAGAPVVLPPKRVPSLFDGLEGEKPKGESTADSATLAQRLGWIDTLLGSQAYKDQAAIVKRQALDEATVRRTLAALDASGGILTPAAFCKATNLPAGRLDGLMAHMQRLVNVDGYEVLIFRRAENRIELNVSKLKRQFALE